MSAKLQLESNDLLPRELSLFSVLFCRDGRMLFDYLAEKHNVSWPDLLTSYFFTAFPMPLVWTRSCFRGEMGGPKTLNSFSGFVRLAQILRTFTFCGELLRINGVARDSWIEPQECRRFYIYRDVWLLSFPSIAPLPLRYPADLRAVPSVPQHNRGAGPLSMLWERPSSPKHPSEWMALRQRTLLRYSGQQEGQLNKRGLASLKSIPYIYLCNCNWGRITTSWLFKHFPGK